MKAFISSRHKRRQTVLSVLIWLLIWQGASMAIKQEMLLASPVSVGRQLIILVRTPQFWSSAGFSISRVLAGFFLALITGLLLGVLAYKLKPAEVFLEPAMTVIKAAPVASYIILCLLFVSSSRLSVVISFLTALPVIYTNMLQGLKTTDLKLLEMAQVFKVSAFYRGIYIYLSHLLPFLVSGCSLALGFCWKSAIAAEVIGLPVGSMGERLYQAKIFVDTKNTLAWTAAIVFLSLAFEKAVLYLLNKLSRAVERM